MKSADFILPQENPIKRTRPFVIVCEGYGDVCFIAELLHHRKIEVCDVGCPTQKHFGDGKGAIPSYLKALATDKKGLKGVLIVGDADEKPAEFFDAMVSAMERASLPAPVKPFVIENREIRVGIFLVPGEGKSGTLEDLLLEAAFEKLPKARQCVEDFAHCTGDANAWKPNQRAKMKMSAIVAAYCEENPWCSLAYVWSQSGNPIPIESESFRQLSDFLVAFSA